MPCCSVWLNKQASYVDKIIIITTNLKEDSLIKISSKIKGVRMMVGHHNYVPVFDLLQVG
jgi:spore coat polysaccharide biosynthesis protein SpsF (cytidylyltransferase family)